MKSYVLTHNHSDFSTLDGISKIPDIIKKAKDLNMDTIALTDHGTVAGLIQFYEECKSNNIKPLLGCEFYVCRGKASDKTMENINHRHLVIIAKNLEGYKDLIKLNNLAAENFYRNPRVDKDLVREIASKGNLIGSSACVMGIIAAELFTDAKTAIDKKSIEDCFSYLRED